LLFICTAFCSLLLFFEFSLYDHQFLVSHPHLPEEGPMDADPVPANSEVPEAGDNQDEDGAKGYLEDSESTLSPPHADSEDKGSGKKRKHMEDLTSSGTSNPTDVSQEPVVAKDSVLQMFELLDS
jgi:hypothetical protein